MSYSRFFGGRLVLLSVVTALLVLSSVFVSAASAADGDVTIIVQNQTGIPIMGATAKLLFYGGGKGGYSMDGKITDVNGAATFTAGEIATWLTANGYNPSSQIFIQPGAKVTTDTAYGNVRTVDQATGFPIIPYNIPGASLVAKPAMSFTYNMIMMSTAPVQTTWNDSNNNFKATANLAESLSVTPYAMRLRLIRNLVGSQPPAAGGSDDDWYMWNGAAYERWKGIATVDATITGASLSATFSQTIFSDWLAGNKVIVRPEIWISRTVGSVSCVDDYYAADITRSSSYIHPAQINGNILFYPTIQDAVNAASSGDTINVAAGTYTEQININKPLTLSGADSDTTNIVSPDPPTMTIYDAFGSKSPNSRYLGHRGTNIPVVRIISSDVTFEGFHVNMNDYIFWDVKGSYPADTTFSRGVGILVDHVETVPGTPDVFTNVKIQNNKITGMLQNDKGDAIKVLGSATATIEGNTIYAYGESAINAQAVDSPTRALYYPTVTANSNTIYGGNIARDSDHYFFGIGYWSGATGTADGNTIYNSPNDNGYALNAWGPRPISFTNNIITTDGGNVGGYGGQFYESSNLTLSDNFVEKQSLAGAIWSNPVFVAEGNVIRDCVDGFIVDGQTSRSVTINSNSITGISAGHYAIDNDAHNVSIWGTMDKSTIKVDATKNYWGSVNPNFTAIVSGNVDYRPWYIDSALTRLNEEVTSCSPGDVETDTYGTDVGECSTGIRTRVCSAAGSWGTWSITTTAVEPVVEVCTDGKDNDCDGYIDGADTDCSIKDYYTKLLADSIFAKLTDIVDMATQAWANGRFALKSGLEALTGHVSTLESYFTAGGEIKDANVPDSIARDTEVSSAVGAEATARSNADTSLEDRAAHNEDGVDIYLSQGWNKFKMPWFVLTGTGQVRKLGLADYNVTTVLASIDGKYSYLAYYDGSAWQTFVKGNATATSFTTFPTAATSKDYDFHIYITSTAGARLTIPIAGPR